MELNEQHEYAKRLLDDGRTLYVVPISYGNARLCIGNKYCPMLFDNVY